MAKSKSSSSGGERDVVFRLGVEGDPRTGRTISELLKALGEARKSIEQTEKAAARSILTEIERAKGQIGNLSALAAKGFDSSVRSRSTSTPSTSYVTSGGSPVRQRQSADTQERLRQEREDRIERESILREKAREAAAAKREQDRQNAAAARQRANTTQRLDALQSVSGVMNANPTPFGDRLLQDRRKSLEQLSTLEAKYRASDQTEAAKTVRETIAHYTAQDREAQRLHDRHRARQLSMARDTKKRAEQEEADSVKAIRSAQREQERAMGQIHAGRVKMAEGFVAATESIARFGRGFAALGLVGEENTDKLLRGLIKVQAVFDLVSGGVATAKNAGNLMAGMRTVSKGASALSTVGNVANTAAGVGGAAVAGKMLMGGGAAAAGGTTATTTAGAAAGGSIAAPVAAFAAAIAASIGAVVSFVQTIGDARKYGIGGGAAPGSWREKVAQGAVGAMSWADDMLPAQGARDAISFGPAAELKGLRESKARVKATEGRYAAFTDQQQRNEAQGAAKVSADDQLRTIAESRRAVRQSMRIDAFQEDRSGQRRMDALQERAAALRFKPQTAATDAEGAALNRMMRDERVRAVPFEVQQKQYVAQQATETAKGDLRDAQRYAGSLGADSSYAEKEAAMQRIAELHQKVADLTRDGLAVEKQVADVRSNSIQKSIEGIQEEIALRRETGAGAEENLKSSKERFGQLGEVEQQATIRAKQRADEFGYDSLSKKDRQRLRALGTEEETKGVKDADIRKAEAAGYDKFFGGSERQKIESSKEAEKRLQVELKDRRAVQVSINDNLNGVSAIVANQVSAYLDQRDAMLRARIQADLNARLGTINLQTMQRNQARRDAV